MDNSVKENILDKEEDIQLAENELVDAEKMSQQNSKPRENY